MVNINLACLFVLINLIFRKLYNGLDSNSIIVGCGGLKLQAVDKGSRLKP